ncbi:TPA: hypothetical protein QCX17_004832 [Bacillus cereus]|uniref:hypothetical protein n=1 Tax=Bacillus cereus TaxID=1396 RepID=UPI00065B5EFD|nr:hypothetical protein [Bacillus cereus]KMP52907.1 hypothetical protein TU59_10645 [Bacillus cereus]MDA2407718.1 hypothetical protein [Bacillus cereus]MDZ4434167.1 hypothetical protein [Bacillus cereus]MDZ4448787.1 hypothetical protein [Bacillus cereus]MDZ4611784.1 hypothetical protein [Bacillus cereus]
MGIILYFAFYFGVLFLIIGTALVLFIMASLPKIWSKNLSFVMIGLGINILTIPLSFFIGGMATDSPDSTRLDFWKGFFFIQKIPLFLLSFLLFLTVVLWFIRKNKKKVNI